MIGSSQSTSPGAAGGVETPHRERRAIIDIGSNTVRLVVFNGPARAPVVLLNEKVSARLGKDLGRTGAIGEKGMRAALSALARFAEVLRLTGIDNVECVATAAARDAANGPELLEAVRGFGLSPRLLTGEEEAHASATGVLSAFPGAAGFVADLGGGSLELVEIDGREPLRGLSIPFGTLRLPDLRASGGASFGAAFRKALRKEGWEGHVDLPIYACGGSWRALALQAMRESHWPIDDPHGFELAGDQALRICRRLAKGKLADPDPRISSSRQATLPDAAALLAQLILQLKPPRVVFSSWALREGLLHLQLPEGVRAEDPLIVGVNAFAADAHVLPSSAVAITRWIAPAFAADPDESRLRLAGTTLALAGMRTEPNMRTEEAMGWALRKRWIALDARGRAMMAMTVFANAGLTEIPAQFLHLASREDLDTAIGWGLAVRLCRRLTASTATGLAQTAIRREQGRLVLILAEPVQALYSNSVGKDLKALAQWLGLEWAVEVNAPG